MVDFHLMTSSVILRRSDLGRFEAVLLDMNGTFMFGEDRFGPSENFYERYRMTDGKLPTSEVNRIIREAYDYLDRLYPNPDYRETFPSLDYAIRKYVASNMSEVEIGNLIDTFAAHEIGSIPDEYADAIRDLSRDHVLGAVVDIWSPKAPWLNEFRRRGVKTCFSALSFSSELGVVKPSPKPFLAVLNELAVPKSSAVVIGDSPRRDLGGAKNAGLECILVGGATHPSAIGSFENLLELVHAK